MANDLISVTIALQSDAFSFAWDGTATPDHFRIVSLFDSEECGRLVFEAVKDEKPLQPVMYKCYRKK